MKKKRDYLKDWTEQDFIDLICEMANVKIANNLPLTANESRIYLNFGDEYNAKKREKIMRIKSSMPTGI